MQTTKLKVVGYLDFNTSILYKTKTEYLLGMAKSKIIEKVKATAKLLTQIRQAAKAEILKDKAVNARLNLKRNGFSYVLRSMMLSAYQAIKLFNKSVDSFLKVREF